MAPNELGASELRSRLGVVMQRAAAGESFNVTRRGKPHVRLLPPLVQQPELVDVA